MPVFSMRAGVIGLAVILVAVIATSVAVALATAQPGGQMWVLVDDSPSDHSISAGVVACATQAADRAIARGETLRISPISGSTTSMYSAPISTAIGIWTRLTPNAEGSAQRRLRATADAEIHALLTAPPPPTSSDVLAATAYAGSQLAEKPAARRTLVVCSDTHDVGEGHVNLYVDPLDSRSRRKLLRHLAPLLPNLNGGVDIVFGAAGLDSKAHLDEVREAEIATFWAGWAAAVHARSFTYGASPVFIAVSINSAAAAQAPSS